MAEPQQLTSLDIVGFAESVSADLFPVIVPAVYRLHVQPSRYFVPPFRESEGYLYGASEIDQDEFETLVLAGDITEFEAPRPAKEDHELWFDETGAPHYDPIAVATQKLTEIADAAIKKATHALAKNDFAAARKHASLAIAADDRRPEPFALRAAVDFQSGRAGAIELQKMMSPAEIGEDAFRMLVYNYCGRVQPVVALQVTRFSAMHRAAARKPQLQQSLAA